MNKKETFSSPLLSPVSLLLHLTYGHLFSPLLTYPGRGRRGGRRRGIVLQLLVAQHPPEPEKVAENKTFSPCDAPGQLLQCNVYT